MDVRERDLSQIKAYIDDVDKEVTMILQSLQWDRKHLLEVSLFIKTYTQFLFIEIPLT